MQLKQGLFAVLISIGAISSTSSITSAAIMIEVGNASKADILSLFPGG